MPPTITRQWLKDLGEFLKKFAETAGLEATDIWIWKGMARNPGKTIRDVDVWIQVSGNADLKDEHLANRLFRETGVEARGSSEELFQGIWIDLRFGHGPPPKPPSYKLDDYPTGNDL